MPVGAVGGESVGVVLVVDAVAIVGVTVVGAVEIAAVCAADAESVVVGESAAEFQTFPGDAASVAGQQVSQLDFL